VTPCDALSQSQCSLEALVAVWLRL